MRCRAALTAWMVVLLWLLPLSAVQAETVRIAAEDDWPPYSSASRDHQRPEGFAVDLIREVFASRGVQVEFVLVPFSRCLVYAQNGTAAGCFNVTITRENRDIFLWHSPPMFEEDLSIFARADSPSHDLKLADLKHRTVGYTMGYTYTSEFTSDPDIDKYSAPSDQHLLKMLVAGRVDYILLNRAPGLLRINASPAFRGQVKRVGKVSSDGFWLAFSKTHPDGQRMSMLFEQGLREFRRGPRYQAMMAEIRRKVGDR